MQVAVDYGAVLKLALAAAAAYLVYRQIPQTEKLTVYTEADLPRGAIPSQQQMRCQSMGGTLHARMVGPNYVVTCTLPNGTSIPMG